MAGGPTAGPDRLEERAGGDHRRQRRSGFGPRSGPGPRQSLPGQLRPLVPLGTFPRTCRRTCRAPGMEAALLEAGWLDLLVLPEAESGAAWEVDACLLPRPVEGTSLLAVLEPEPGAPAAVPGARLHRLGRGDRRPLGRPGRPVAQRHGRRTGGPLGPGRPATWARRTGPAAGSAGCGRRAALRRRRPHWRRSRPGGGRRPRRQEAGRGTGGAVPALLAGVVPRAGGCAGAGGGGAAGQGGGGSRTAEGGPGGGRGGSRTVAFYRAAEGLPQAAGLITRA